MQYRKLGKIDVDFSVIGLGTEYLFHEPRGVVTDVVHRAFDNGVNYFDIWAPEAELRDKFGFAFRGMRDEILIAGHLGSALDSNGSYHRTRDLRLSEEFFHDLLRRLGTDHIDFLMMHYVDDKEDCNAVFRLGGFYELALSLQSRGEARYIGMSSHKTSVPLEVVKKGLIDLLMFPINPAFDLSPGDVNPKQWWKEPEHTIDIPIDSNRQKLYHICQQKGVGIVAMKPYAGGRLLNGSIAELTPVQCLSYCLTRPAVVTAIPGCKNPTEMDQALKFLESTEEERDFSSVKLLNLGLRGGCVYCNHCLPCPADIDIGGLTRLLDTAKLGVTPTFFKEYQLFEHNASECLGCGSCIKRCPFDVDIISNMQKVATLLGTHKEHII